MLKHCTMDSLLGTCMLFDGGARCCELLHMLLLKECLSRRAGLLQQCCIHRIML